MSDKMNEPKNSESLRARTGRLIKENPLGLVTAGFAVGLLTGLALPSTSYEDERLGEASDRAKEQVQQSAQDLLDHGKEVAKEALSGAVASLDSERPD